MLRDTKSDPKSSSTYTYLHNPRLNILTLFENIKLNSISKSELPTSKKKNEGHFSEDFNPDPNVTKSSQSDF